jgi:hypothetical protein
MPSLSESRMARYRCWWIGELCTTCQHRIPDGACKWKCALGRPMVGVDECRKRYPQRDICKQEKQA